MDSVRHRFLQELNNTYLLRNFDPIRELNLTDQDIQYIVNLANQMKMATTPASVSLPSAACYCEGAWRNIAVKYRSVHGYVSLFVCIFGTLANTINIAVLTRRQMKTASSFAYILTWLAVTDMLLMIEYIPFVSYTYTDLRLNTTRFSYGGAVYTLIHMHLSQVLHTMSICLTLTLAFWRHNAVRFPQKCSTLWTKQKCATVVRFAMLVPTFICIPSFFMFSIQSTLIEENGVREHAYQVDLSELAKSNSELLYILNLWLYAVVIKLLPCVVLIVISVALIKALRNTTERKAKLQQHQQQQTSCTSTTSAITLNNHNKNIKLERTRKRADRSTHMLIAILFLFLLTELPQCILGVLSGVLGRCFFRNCYHLFGEIMDILALLNGAINFILYCSVSEQFRSTFAKLFHCIQLPKRSKNNTYEHHI